MPTSSGNSQAFGTDWLVSIAKIAIMVMRNRKMTEMAISDNGRVNAFEGKTMWNLQRLLCKRAIIAEKE